MKYRSLILSCIFCFAALLQSFGQHPEYSAGPDLNLNPSTQYDSLFYPIPEIIYSKNPSDDYIFTIVKHGLYLYTTDNYGNVIFFRKIISKASNFQVHDSGILTYFDHKIKGFVALDKFYNVVDTFLMQNGYTADMHDFVLEENGDCWMLAYDRKSIDMSQIVTGGDPNATVKGLVLQKLDRNKNVLFEWQSWDHFSLTDSYISLTTSFIDYVHGNSINSDSDTSIIISSRNLNEVTRINTNTGEIIWRLGGKNNQFTFINDNLGFAGQHSAIKQENGNLTLYDNGVRPSPRYSRGLEYKLDEVNRTVTLLGEYVHNPKKFAIVEGNMQKLSNENSLIYWGTVSSETTSTVSEYSFEGGLEFEMLFKNRFTPDYRVIRSPWKSEVFSIEPDSLSFYQNQIDQEIVKKVEITNTSEKAIIINALYHKSAFISLLEPLPVEIQAGESHLFNIAFQADSKGLYNDILNFGMESDTSLITTQLFVKAEADLVNNRHDRVPGLFTISPNPFSDKLIVSSNKVIHKLRLHNTNGRLILEQEGSTKEISISTGSLDSGVYILTVSGDDLSLRRKLVVRL